MLRTSETESEILLGNKQLLGIFFVVAILLGVAFYGGYMVGKATPSRVASSNASETASSGSGNGTAAGSGGETHTISRPTRRTAPVLPRPTQPSLLPLNRSHPLALRNREEISQ